MKHQTQQPLALDARLEATHHGLDFRQFGHGLVSTAGGGYGAKVTAKETADFGYRRVAAREHTRLVHDVFARVARRYDLMNDLMSGGIHRLWKAELIDRLGPRPGQVLLDVAGGTGDIARRFVARAPGAHAIICDINTRMLEAGRARSLDAGDGGAVRWLCGDAEALPLASGSVDACTIAFGLRNVTRIPAALAEMRRILRPGGHFLCLEFSNVEGPLVRRAYDLYSFAVLPRLGAVIAGDRDAYQYLVESIRRFPDRQRLVQLMREAGFERVTARPLSGGIAAIHSGWRL
ncbi:MAG: class I SAM-dependent methyltransferase [Alphaproteobacteria bacterium]|nr:class I SAM-dependent methyltransferase [Alphaproteobacteria bacterium]